MCPPEVDWRSCLRLWNMGWVLGWRKRVMSSWTACFPHVH